MALMGLGIWGLIEAENLRASAELLSDLPVEAVAYCIIFLGGISSLACYSGLHGSCTKKAKLRRLLLSAYLFTLFCVMLIQLCMCVFLYQYGTAQALDDVVEDRWFEEGEEALQRRIDYQDYFDCCGWANAYDSRASGYNTPCPRTNPTACREATIGRSFPLVSDIGSPEVMGDVKLRLVQRAVLPHCHLRNRSCHLRGKYVRGKEKMDSINVQRSGFCRWSYRRNIGCQEGDRARLG